MTYDPGHGSQQPGVAPASAPEPADQAAAMSPHPTSVMPQLPGPQHPGPPYPATPYPATPYPTMPYSAPPPPAPPHDPGPRPAMVSAAAYLTFAGLVLALGGTVLTYLFFDGLFAEVVRISESEARASDELQQVLTFYSGAGVTFAAAVNVAAGAGAAVCAVFVLRGANAARVTLCALVGVFAGWKLTCGGGWLINTINLREELERDGFAGDQINPPYELLYAAIAVDVALALIAVAILVMLLVGPANRWFSRPKPPPLMTAVPVAYPPPMYPR